MKYLGINITEFMQEVFTEKYKRKFEIKTYENGEI